MGSNPIARSKPLRDRPADRQAISRNRVATWPSGKAEVCKTSITGSNPVVAFCNSIGALGSRWFPAARSERFSPSPLNEHELWLCASSLH